MYKIGGSTVLEDLSVKNLSKVSTLWFSPVSCSSDMVNTCSLVGFKCSRTRISLTLIELPFVSFDFVTKCGILNEDWSALSILIEQYLRGCRKTQFCLFLYACRFLVVIDICAIFHFFNLVVSSCRYINVHSTASSSTQSTHLANLLAFFTHTVPQQVFPVT